MEYDKYGIPVIECETPGKFLHQLDESRQRWKNETWIFRGQNDSTWSLLPSAMRKDIITKFVDKYYKSYSDRNMVMKELVTDETAKSFCESKDPNAFREHIRHVLNIVAEIKYVGGFLELADQSGLEVPVDNPAAVAFTRWPLDRLVRHYLNQSCVTNIRHDPKSIVYALAQHHDIPTRLLDWTFRPMVAAYFAAHESERQRSKPGYSQPENMAVWAVRWTDVQCAGLFRVTHLRSQLGQLQAQAGLFLYDPLADSYRRSEGCWLCFDRLLETIVNRGAVYKFSLPFSKRLRVLKLLERKGYSRPHLMPTHDNVAQEFTSGRLDPVEFMKRF